MVESVLTGERAKTAFLEDLSKKEVVIMSTGSKTLIDTKKDLMYLISNTTKQVTSRNELKIPVSFASNSSIMNQISSMAGKVDVKKNLTAPPFLGFGMNSLVRMNNITNSKVSTQLRNDYKEAIDIYSAKSKTSCSISGGESDKYTKECVKKDVNLLIRTVSTKDSKLLNHTLSNTKNSLIVIPKSIPAILNRNEYVPKAKVSETLIDKTNQVLTMLDNSKLPPLLAMLDTSTQPSLLETNIPSVDNNKQVPSQCNNNKQVASNKSELNDIRKDIRILSRNLSLKSTSLNAETIKRKETPDKLITPCLPDFDRKVDLNYIPVTALSTQGHKFGTSIMGLAKLAPVTTCLSSQPNIMDVSTQPNIMDVSTQPNIMDVSTQPNIMDVSTQPNIMDVSTQPNIMDVSTQPNILGVSPPANLIGVSPPANLIGVSSQANLIGVSSQANLIGVSSQANLIGVSSQANLIGVSSQANLIGVSSQANLIGVSSQANLIGVSSQANLIGVSSQANIFDASYQLNILSNIATSSITAPSNAVTTSDIDLLCHEMSLPPENKSKIANLISKPRKNRRKPIHVFKSLPNPAEQEKEYRSSQTNKDITYESTNIFMKERKKLSIHDVTREFLNRNYTIKSGNMINTENSDKQINAENSVKIINTGKRVRMYNKITSMKVIKTEKRMDKINTEHIINKIYIEKTGNESDTECVKEIDSEKSVVDETLPATSGINSPVKSKTPQIPVKFPKFPVKCKPAKEYSKSKSFAKESETDDESYEKKEMERKRKLTLQRKHKTLAKKRQQALKAKRDRLRRKERMRVLYQEKKRLKRRQLSDGSMNETKEGEEKSASVKIRTSQRQKSIELKRNITNKNVIKGTSMETPCSTEENNPANENKEKQQSKELYDMMLTRKRQTLRRKKNQRITKQKDGNLSKIVQSEQSNEEGKSKGEEKENQPSKNLWSKAQLTKRENFLKRKTSVAEKRNKSIKNTKPESISVETSNGEEENNSDKGKRKQSDETCSSKRLSKRKKSIEVQNENKDKGNVVSKRVKTEISVEEVEEIENEGTNKNTTRLKVDKLCPGRRSSMEQKNVVTEKVEQQKGLKKDVRGIIKMNEDLLLDKSHNTRFRGKKSVIPSLNLSPRKYTRQICDASQPSIVLPSKLDGLPPFKVNCKYNLDTKNSDSCIEDDVKTPSTSSHKCDTSEKCSGGETFYDDESSVTNKKNSIETEVSCIENPQKRNYKRKKKRLCNILTYTSMLKPVQRVSNEIRTGDIVWGRCLGHGWWPGRVMSLLKSKREAYVSWHYSSTTSIMATTELDLFLPNFKKRFATNKSGGYVKAVVEAQKAWEETYGVL